MYNLSIFSDRIKEQMFEYDESMKSEHLALKLGVTGATSAVGSTAKRRSRWKTPFASLIFFVAILTI